jgi:hypothetical protein
MSATEGGPADPLTPYEAEHIVDSLECLDFESIGTPKWLKQHSRIERLNAQAHRQAKDGTDEFVVDHLTTLGKIPVLIHSLLSIELWKAKVFPHLEEHVCKLSALRSYVPIYHEASCINLLECCMFHRTSCEAAEDSVIDLIDYCYRKLVYLASVPNSKLYSRVLSAAEAGELSDLDVLHNQKLDLEFQICMCVVSVARFLTDHRAGLPLSATVRLLDTQDFLMCFVPLVEKAPWVRKNTAGEVQKYEKQEWVLVPEDDMSKLPELQVQLMLAVHNLTMDPECRNRYYMTSSRKDNLLRLRRFLNDVVFDQVPPLANLLRTLEELSITGQYTGVEEVHGSGAFVVELVAEIRERLVQTFDGRYEEIARTQRDTVFVKETEEELRGLASMFTMPESMTAPICVVCHAEAEMRCSKCHHEWYCSRQCQVKDWKRHKGLCTVICEAAATAPETPLIQEVKA